MGYPLMAIYLKKLSVFHIVLHMASTAALVPITLGLSADTAAPVDSAFPARVGLRADTREVGHLQL